MLHKSLINRKRFKSRSTASQWAYRMTDDSKEDTYLSFLWKLTAPLLPFIIFLILGIFELDIFTRLCVGAIGVIVWVGVLTIGFVRDWQKRNLENLRILTRSDALVTLWHTTIDINEDGSAVVARKIYGRNFADKRNFFEFLSQADMERSPEYLEETKELRAMDISVCLRRKDGSHQQVFTDQRLEPKVVRNVDALTHIIPLVKPAEGIASLEPGEGFEVEIRENVKAGTFLMTGDFYAHRVRHLTEELEIEMLLPEEWQFPRKLKVGEKRVIGQVKSPTLGEWEEDLPQPKIGRSGNRVNITWNLEHRKLIPYGKIKIEEMHPRLLHQYKVKYGRLERGG